MLHPFLHICRVYPRGDIPSICKRYFFAGAGAGAAGFSAGFSGAGAAFSGAGAGAAGFASSFGAGFGGSCVGPHPINATVAKNATATNNITNFFMYFHLLSLLFLNLIEYIYIISLTISKLNFFNNNIFFYKINIFFCAQTIPRVQCCRRPTGHTLYKGVFESASLA